jgi:hypothetical protein
MVHEGAAIEHFGVTLVVIYTHQGVAPMTWR